MDEWSSFDALCPGHPLVSDREEVGMRIGIVTALVIIVVILILL